MPLTAQQNLDILKDRAREQAKTDKTAAVYGLIGNLTSSEELKHLSLPHKVSEGTTCETVEEVNDWIDSFKL